MKSGSLLLICLLTTLPVYAQNLDISLFDDDDVDPILGRQAEPLQELRLTPPPLPNISVDLGTNTPQVPEIQMPQIPDTQPIQPSAAISLPPPTVDEQGKPVSATNVSVVPPHDVRSFEFKGLYLGLSLKSATALLERKGFKIKTMREDLPLFYTSDYEHKCRKTGRLRPEDIRKCVLNTARTENQAYIAEVIATKANETIHLFFTSNNSYNELYKIVYYNYGDTSLNFTRVNTMKKELRQKEFWAAVFNTFGRPDDADNMVWGDPNKAFMQATMFGSAYNAMITLVDEQMYARDYFAAEDTEKERPPKNNFSFE